MFSEADIDRANYLTGHVKDSLGTTKKWSLHDFREFYQRDITAAIQLATAVLREAEREKREDSLRGYPACIECGAMHSPYATCGDTVHAR